MRQHNKHIPISRFGLVVLFVAGIIIASGAYVVAKMINTTPIERDSSMQVAGWSVDVQSTSGNNVTLVAGGVAQTYSLKVTNNSEVASTYTIKVSGIPAGVKVGLDIASNNDLVTPTNSVATFSNTGGALGYDDTNQGNERTHVLTLLAIEGASVTPDGGANMTVEVLFEQEDPRL